MGLKGGASVGYNLEVETIKKHRILLIGLLMLWALFFLGHNWEEGLKMDAMIESAVAKHLLIQTDWTVFHFAPESFRNGFYDHPPFLIWIEALFFKMFGVSDSIARIPPALFGLGTLLAVFYWGFLNGGTRTGFLASFILLTSNRYIKFASDVLLEGPLCFFLSWGAVFYLLAMKEGSKHRWRNSILLGLCWGGAFLTKSIFAAILPISIWIGFLWNRKKWGRFSLVNALAALGFLVVVGVWILWGRGWPFMQAHFAMLFGRAQSREFSKATIAIKNILTTYWPWLPFFILGLSKSLKRKEPSEIGYRLAEIMCFVVLVIFSLGNQIWEHYVILFLPPAAIVSAPVLDSLIGRYFERFEKGVFGLAIVVAMFLACYPTRIRRERSEPLGSALVELQRACSGQTQVLVSESVMEHWMAMAIVAWKTSLEGASIPSIDIPAKEGQLLITQISEQPSSDWVKTFITRSKLAVFQPVKFHYCKK